MTYCVALKLQQGLVLVSDSRTNAGVDHISSFRKLFKFEVMSERSIFIQTSGNLATTQSVISHLEQAIIRDTRNLLNVSSMFEVAELVGEAIRQVISRDTGQDQGIDFGCSMLVSGEISGDGIHLFHVYREGNFIEACEDTPYFQVGESKYGKPILDRVIKYETALDRGLQCALISMDSTLRSNLSVGLPLDYLVYRIGRLGGSNTIKRIDEHDQAFFKLRTAWSDGLNDQFNQLPMYIEYTEDTP